MNDIESLIILLSGMLLYVPIHEFGHILVFRMYGIKTHLVLENKKSFGRLGVGTVIRVVPNDETTMIDFPVKNVLIVAASGGLFGLIFLIIYGSIFLPMMVYFGKICYVIYVCFYGILYTIYEIWDNWQLNNVLPLYSERHKKVII